MAEPLSIMQPTRSPDHARAVLAEAKSLRAAGFALVRVEPGKKKPVDVGWQTGQGAEPAAFVSGDTAFNIAIVCGPASGGVVCIDCDGVAHEQAERELPPTAMIDVRPGRQGSHRWYRLEGTAFPPNSLPAPSTRTGMLMAQGVMPSFPGVRNLRVKGDNSIGVEFRGAGACTLAPPSLTASGPRYWLHGRRMEPATVPFATLMAAVERLAVGLGWRSASQTGGGVESDRRTHPMAGVGMADWSILQRMRGAQNGDKFRRLWETKEATSEDDAALVAMLAFWTTDPAQIERLWLGSPCGQRAKTQDRADYRTRTIRFVLGGAHVA